MDFAHAVGERLVVRYYLDEVGPTGRRAMSDVIGRLIHIRPGTLTLEDRDGQLVTIDRPHIVAVKQVPRRPKRSRSAHSTAPEQLFEISARGWPAIESEHLGHWQLRASSGFTKRANSVAICGAPGVDFGEARAAVTQFYSDRGLRPLVQTIHGSPWEESFLAAGWVPTDDGRSVSIAMSMDMRDHYTPVPDISFSTELSDEWLSGFTRLEAPQIARTILQAPPTVGFASNGHRAIGRVTVTGEWAGLYCIEVPKAQRRQSWGSRIIESSLVWASNRGATKAYLDVAQSNRAAIDLYAKHGFTESHRYQFLTPGDAPTPKQVHGRAQEVHS